MIESSVLVSSRLFNSIIGLLYNSIVYLFWETVARGIGLWAGQCGNRNPANEHGAWLLKEAGASVAGSRGGAGEGPFRELQDGASSFCDQWRNGEAAGVRI